MEKNIDASRRESPEPRARCYTDTITNTHNDTATSTSTYTSTNRRYEWKIERKWKGEEFIEPENKTETALGGNQEETRSISRTLNAEEKGSTAQIIEIETIPEVQPSWTTKSILGSWAKQSLQVWQRIND